MSGEDSVGLKYQTIYDLSGGMVSNYSFTKVKRNQYNLLLNGDLTTDGAVTTRLGKVKLNQSTLNIEEPSINTGTVVGSLSTLGSTSADLIFAFADTDFNEISTGAPVLIRTGLTPNSYLQSAALDNYLFNVDGVDTPFMTDGTAANTYQIGITEVSNAQFVGFTVGAGPFLNGDATPGSHRITYRYRSSITGARSNPNIIGTDISFRTIVVPADPNDSYQVVIGAAAVSVDPQVDFIDVFVQQSGSIQDAPYYFLGSITNAAGTYNFTTNVSDGALGVLETLDTDDDVAPNELRDITEWRGRFLAIKNNYQIGYSKQRVDANGIVDLPTSWPDDNEVNVGFGDGDPLVKVITFNDYVFAFKRKSVWILLGDFDSPQFEFKRLKTNFTNVGLLNLRSVCQAGERIFFITDDLKFYFFGITDFSSEQLRLSVPPASDPVGNLFRTFASTYRDNVNVVNYTFANYTQVWISFSNGNSNITAGANFNIFVFDWSQNDGQGAWHIHTNIEMASGVLARDNQGNYNVYIGDYYGFVWKTGIGIEDGAAINSTSTGGNYNILEYSGIVGGPFIDGEPITGVTSLTTGTILSVAISELQINNTNALFLVGEQVQGATSGAIATIDDYYGVFNDTTQNFTTPGVEGVFLSILSGPGENQIRRILVVDTATRLFVSPFEVVPTDLSEYTIGGIDFQLWSRYDWCDEGAPPDFDKLGWYLDIDIELYGNYSVSVFLGLNRTFDAISVGRSSTYGGATWGTAIWGVDVWGESTKNFMQIGFNYYFKQIQHRIINKAAAQPVRINGWTYCYQNLEHMRPL